MIHILDNGGQYSEHDIYFVESDLAPEQVDRLLARLAEEAQKFEWETRDDMGLVYSGWQDLGEMERVASAPEISWREPGSTTTFEELFAVDVLEDHRGEFIWGKDAEAGRELYRRVMSEIRA